MFVRKHCASLVYYIVDKAKSKRIFLLKTRIYLHFFSRNNSDGRIWLVYKGCIFDEGVEGRLLENYGLTGYLLDTGHY